MYRQRQKARERKDTVFGFGEVEVTSGNKDDILVDGGKAKYDPDTGTLTLADPSLKTGLKNAIYGENDPVALTVSPDQNCKLESISVKDADGNEVDLTETQKGYEFAMPESDVTVSAVFTRYYSISIDEDSQAYIEIDQTEEATGKTVTVKLIEVEGYRVKSIHVTDAEGNEIKISDDYTFTMPASEVTVTAEVVKLFTLTFDLDGGSYKGESTYTVECEEGTVITMPEPSKDGYTFAFWQGLRYYAGESYTVTEDHHFKAIWNKKSESEYYRIPITGIE